LQFSFMFLSAKVKASLLLKENLSLRHFCDKNNLLLDGYFHK